MGLGRIFSRAETEIACGAALSVEWIAAEQCRFSQVVGFVEELGKPEGWLVASEVGPLSMANPRDPDSAQLVGLLDKRKERK